MSTPGRAAREARVKVQPVPLAAKMVEERPLLGDIKDVEEDASRNKREISKEAEEKENRVGRKEEQASHSWRRSVAVAPRK